MTEAEILKRGDLPPGHKLIRRGKWIPRNGKYRDYLKARRKRRVKR